MYSPLGSLATHQGLEVWHTPTSGQHLHHLLSFGELLEHTIHILGFHPRPGRDPPLATTTDNLGVPALFRSHRLNDCFDSANVAIIDVNIAK
jgi:hypothetical protein